MVAGASNGIGRAVAHDLAAQGATVIGLSHRVARLRSVMRDIELETGRPTFAVAVDATDRSAIHEALMSLKGGGVDAVDLLINIVELEDPEVEALGADPDQWWHIVSRYIRTTQLLIYELVPGMVDRGNGRIVSLLGNPTGRSRPARDAHGVGRAGLTRLTDILAGQLAGTGVRVFQVVPPDPRRAPTSGPRLSAQSSWPDPGEVVALVRAIARGELDQWSGLSIHAARGQTRRLGTSRPPNTVSELRSRHPD
ncbi:MAG: short-chain dehydrogenase/reductase [Frankiales bacterium]|nr:short-chain dehydrogenase/reductase [Frankiales bacterium]